MADEKLKPEELLNITYEPAEPGLAHAVGVV